MFRENRSRPVSAKQIGPLDSADAVRTVVVDVIEQAPVDDHGTPRMMITADVEGRPPHISDHNGAGPPIAVSIVGLERGKRNPPDVII